MKKSQIASLTFALGKASAGAVQLLPAGEFKATDGRPMPWGSWKLNERNAPDVVALANRRKNEFVIDYEHQTQLADKNGQPAPAAGWFKQIEFRPGEGLFTKDARWTARATGYIEAEEYKYISAVFVFDKYTGEVEQLLCAALTNNPGLDGMDEVQLAALTARFSTADIDPANSSVDNPSEHLMNKVLLALLKALDLPETDATTEAQALSAVAALKGATTELRTAAGVPEAATAEQAVQAVAALKVDAGKLATVSSEVAALKAGGNPDPTKFVSLESFNALNGEVAALRASGVATEVDKLIEQARGEGKCSPVVEKVWRDIGKADIAQLKALIKETPANPALAGKSQTEGGRAAQADPKAPGTPDELAMCKNMGLTLEQLRGGADVQEDATA